MKVLPLGDSALLLTLGEHLGEESHGQVRAALAALTEAELPGVVELVPAFTTLAVHYAPAEVLAHLPGEEPSPAARLTRVVRDVLLGAAASALPDSRLVEVPVCYGGESGPDLEAVAQHAGLSPDEVARRHAAALYTVHLIGFAPGFPYLAGLPPGLAAPRHASPRARVPAGSVGIAGAQTGIYPAETPGGWQLIGRTPRCLFRADRTPPALLRMGDRVRFRPITAAELAAWEEGPWEG
jgi:inhibitor of KinA